MTNLYFCGMKVFIAAGVRSVNDQELAERLNVAGDAQREGNFELADTILCQVLADHPHSELPVDVLCPLTVRTLNILYHQTVVTVADLLKCTLPDLHGWHNFGPRSHMLLGERLRVFDLNLASQRDYKWIKARSKKNKKERLDRCLLLPTFSLPNEQSCFENVFDNYEGPLCGKRVPHVRHDFYPGTEPRCALPLDHPNWCLSAQDIADTRAWNRWTRHNEQQQRLYAPLYAPDAPSEEDA
jgi:hypothetical protein